MRSLYYVPIKPYMYRRYLRRLLLTVDKARVAKLINKSETWIDTQLGENTPERRVDDLVRWEEGVQRCIAANDWMPPEQIREILGPMEE